MYEVYLDGGNPTYVGEVNDEALARERAVRYSKIYPERTIEVFRTNGRKELLWKFRAGEPLAPGA